MKFIPRAWRLFMHLRTPFGHFAKEICLLLFLDRNGKESWVCLSARDCWWSSGTMMWAEIPIQSWMDSSKHFLGDCPVCWTGNTVPLSRWEKVPVRAEMQWCWAQAGGPKRSCNCAPEWKLILSWVHRVTAWCVHTSSAGTTRGGCSPHGHIPHGSRPVGTSQAGSQDIYPISRWEAEAQDPWSCHSQVSSVEDGCVEVHPRWDGGASRQTWWHIFRHSQYISTFQELQTQSSTRSHVMPDKK